MLTAQKRSIDSQADFTVAFDIESLLIEKGIKAPAELLDLIVHVMEKVPSLSEATIVNLANHLNITMFGREISDKVTKNPGRKIYNLHPYRKAGSGAVCMATYTDEAGQSHVLLGQKKPRGMVHDKRQILLGGYFQPYPLAGHIEGLEKLTPEQKDEIEEAIRSGMRNAYMKTPPEEKHVEALPGQTEPTYDSSVASCAKRELREEAGLAGVEPQFLMEQSSYPDTNPDLHSINLSYLFDYGRQLAPPEAKAGSDIGQLQWVKLAEIQVIKKNGRLEYSIGGEPIRQDHGPVLNEGARVLLEKQIQEQSKGLLTLATLEKHLERQAQKANKPLSGLLGPKPDGYLGQAATSYYKKLLKLSEGYQKCTEENTAFNFSRMAACLSGKKPSSTASVAAWCGLFTAVAGLGVVAIKLYQGGNTPSCKR